MPDQATGEPSTRARRIAASLNSLRTALANPDLRRVQIAWAAYQFVEWAFALAVSVYAFDQGGATAVGVAGLVRLLPAALAAPVSGLLSDRHSRRSVMIASATVSAACIGGAAAAAAWDAPAAVYALSAACMVAASAYTPAQRALFPALANTPQELSASNITLSVMDNVGFLAGMVLGGLLLTAASPAATFALVAAVSAISALILTRVRPDRAPTYEEMPEEAGGLRQLLLGFRAVAADRGLRLVTVVLAALAVYVGVIDVLVVVLALDLLDTGPGAVGYLQAAWGVGAIFASGALMAMLGRGALSAALIWGALLIGAATALMGAVPELGVAFLALGVIGLGYTFVEVAGHTLLQRLASDEVLGRVFGLQETLRLAGMALGSIVASVLVALFGVEGALVATGAFLPVLVGALWSALRGYDAGSPVSERRYELLRANSIFMSLPIDTLERVAHDLTPVAVAAGDDVISQGAHGDRFYLIDSGEVDVLVDGARVRSEGPGECFGEIALLKDVPRTATIRATCQTLLLALSRDHFLDAVTGQARSSHSARAVADARLAGEPSPALASERTGG